MIQLLDRAPVSPYVYPGLRLAELTAEELMALRTHIKQADHELIMFAVCKYFGIPSVKLKTRSRKRKIVWPRQVYCYMCMKNTEMVLKEVGETCGYQEHSAVLHCVNTVEDIIKNNDHAAGQIRDLQAKIKSLINQNL